MQASAAHAVNVSLTVRNWLIGYYIVEFEQNGEDRAKYGEKLLLNLEKTLNAKGMTERRFREYRRLYTVYLPVRRSVPLRRTGGISVSVGCATLHLRLIMCRPCGTWHHVPASA
jgi:hypothetical protein